jgi:hypothetical protein
VHVRRPAVQRARYGVQPTFDLGRVLHGCGVRRLLGFDLTREARAAGVVQGSALGNVARALASECVSARLRCDFKQLIVARNCVGIA